MPTPNTIESTTVKCPTCKNSVIWNQESQFRPFCSKKCQMIDFGEWADEEKSIPGAPDMSDSDGWSEDQY
ncbi:DNA gyrase inhibitor YacG [Aliivibrio wodanis]|uniref:DNA gyrase inhibitor YacG n=1 Tax=Aliivibrio wodanis TaxID=80852 RepID=UPI00406C200B